MQRVRWLHAFRYKRTPNKTNPRKQIFRDCCQKHLETKHDRRPSTCANKVATTDGRSRDLRYEAVSTGAIF